MVRVAHGLRMRRERRAVEDHVALAHEGGRGVPVADVDGHRSHALGDPGEVGAVPATARIEGIGDRDRRAEAHTMMREIRADEPEAAGNEDTHPRKVGCAGHPARAVAENADTAPTTRRTSLSASSGYIGRDRTSRAAASLARSASLPRSRSR